MKTVGKLFGVLALIVLFAAVVLGLALTYWINPNDYKPTLVEMARERAGVELTLNGDIGWSLFPWLGITLQDAQVASPLTPDQPLASVQHIDVSVRVLPLIFQRQAQMNAINVNGLDIQLVQLADGTTNNWSGFGQKHSAETPVTSPSTTDAEPAPSDESAPSAQSTLAHNIIIDIDSLRVVDARVSYVDEKENKRINVEGIDITTGAIRQGQTTPVEVTAFFGSNHPIVRARTHWKGQLRTNQAAGLFALEGLVLDGEVSGEPFNDKTLPFTGQGDLSFDLNRFDLNLSSFKFNALQLNALLELQINQLNKKPALLGGITVAPLNARDFLTDIGQKLPVTADANTLTSVQFKTQLEGTWDQLKLNELELQVDETHVTGALQHQGSLWQAQLKGDKLNLDRYLPPKKAKRKVPTANPAQANAAGSSPLPSSPTAQAWSAEPALPLNALRQQNVDLQLRMQQLIVDELPLNTLQLQARNNRGQITLGHFSTSLLGGQLKANGSMDARPATPAISFSLSVRHLPIENWLRQTEAKNTLKGQLDIEADVTTQGSSQREWINNLDGLGRFSISNGVLVNANLDQQLCQAIASIHRKALTTAPRAKDTPFRAISGDLTINQGLVHTNSLSADMPGLMIQGAGDLNLPVLGMDYQLNIEILGDKSAMPDPACQVSPRFAGIQWPVQCRGPISLGAQACRFNTEQMGKIAAKLAGDRLTEKLEEKLGDRVSPELKDALKGLFNR